MLESILIMLIILAILLLVATYEWRDPVISILDSLIWFVCGIGVLYVEIPYQYISGGSVSTATHVITNLYPLAALFMLMGVLLFISFVTLTFEMLSGK